MSCLKLHCFKPHFFNAKLANFSKLVHKNGLYFVSIRRNQQKLAFNSSFNFQCKSAVSFCVAKDTLWSSEGEDREDLELEYLAPGGEVYKKTLRLVECAMFAGVSGLAYILSNSLSVENYFSSFFALPIVFSSMRWGVSAGRKTMVATFFLLLVLSGPVKALTYTLMHGLLGFTMGSLWRLRANWGISIFFCTLVRAVGALGYVLISSFLIEENILALILVNIHASVTYIFTNMGLQLIPSMNVIYGIFGSVLLLNCASFVFLVHIFYAVFFIKYGMKTSLRLPRWVASIM